MLSYSEYRKEIVERYEIQNRRRKTVENFIGNRELWVWGACKKNDWLSDIFGDIKGYIDQDEKKILYNGKTIIPPSQINPKLMYVYVALENRYSEVEELLKQKEMEEYTDYLYSGCSDIVISGCEHDYQDVYGNEIIGGNFLGGCMVHFYRGGSSVLKIGTDCIIAPGVKFIMEKNSIIVVENNVMLGKDTMIVAKSGGIIHIGEYGCIENNVIIHSSCNSYIDIGKNVTINQCGTFAASALAKISIGDDVLFSSSCNVQASDGHQIYDLLSTSSLLDDKNYTIEIGDHVWIGRGCTILYDSQIGRGSIVGIDSLVKKKIPSNVIVAGRPAKIVRKNVVWDFSLENRKDNFEELMIYDYRN